VNIHGVEFDIDMKPKIYTGHLQETASKWLDKHNIEKYILIQFSGGQSALTYKVSIIIITLIEITHHFLHSKSLTI
jgi:hypothetical protein